MGGDELGAAQVNLVPSEKPADIYSEVARRVSAQVERDAAPSLSSGVAPNPIAVRMKGRVNRKLVKQTVMTNTYGVTFIGAKRQVYNRLKENAELYPFTDTEMKETAHYITKLIFESLGELFSRAREIQAWLNTTARMISKSAPENMIPAIQMEDAKFLSDLNCLPSSFTVAKAEIQEDIVKNQLVGEDQQHSGTPASPESAPTAKKSKKKKSSLDGDDALMGLEEDNALLGAALLDESSDFDIEVFDTPSSSSKGGSSLTPSPGTVDLEDPGSLLLSPQGNAEIDSLSLASLETLQDESHDARKETIRKPEKMSSVIWTTPLGLPIVQPYRDVNTKVVRLSE